VPSVQDCELDHSQEREAFIRALEQIYISLQDVAFDLGVPASEQHSAFTRALVTGAYQHIEAKELRDPTPARLSMYSGLSKSQCEAILQDSRFAPESGSTNQAALVLAHWHKSSRFSNVMGVPVELPLKPQPDRESFQSLVEDAAPLSDVNAVLSALLKAKSIELLGNGYVRALSLVLYDKDEKEPRFIRMGRLVRNFVDVWRHNFRSAATNEPSLLEIEAAVDRPLSAAEFLDVSADVRKMCEQFVRDVDVRLNNNQDVALQPTGIRCGLGMYFYVDRDSFDQNIREQIRLAAQRPSPTATFVDLAPQI
jgi:hypothetical protein